MGAWRRSGMWLTHTSRSDISHINRFAMMRREKNKVESEARPSSIVHSLPHSATRKAMIVFARVDITGLPRNPVFFSSFACSHQSPNKLKLLDNDKARLHHWSSLIRPTIAYITQATLMPCPSPYFLFLSLIIKWNSRTQMHIRKQQKR